MTTLEPVADQGRTRILVLGGTGMLGHKMFQTLKARYPQTTCTLQGKLNDSPYRQIELFRQGGVLEKVDAADLSGLARILEEHRPDYVVNCVGIVKQRGEAKAYIPSITLNSLLPHWLAETCRRWNGRVIHFSTDCVFSGRRGGYKDDDPSDAEDLYGKTKFLGEVTADNALTLRTSIIGRELAHFQSLLEWFLSRNHSSIKGYRRALYSGVTTNHLAEVVASLISDHPKLSGLYQVASNTISKYDLLCLLRDAYQLDVEIIPDAEFFCDRSLVGTRFHQATGYICPPWPDLVAQLATDPTPYQDWRSAP